MKWLLSLIGQWLWSSGTVSDSDPTDITHVLTVCTIDNWVSCEYEPRRHLTKKPLSCWSYDFRNECKSVQILIDFGAALQFIATKNVCCQVVTLTLYNWLLLIVEQQFKLMFICTFNVNVCRLAKWNY